MTVFHRDIEAAVDALDQLKRAYLKRWGWSVSCNNPGSYWLWRRDFAELDAARVAQWVGRQARKPSTSRPTPPKPYGVITADLDMAISITLRSLDNQEEEALPDE